MKLKLAFCLIGICLLGCEPKKTTSPAGKTPAAHSHAASLPEAIKELDEHIGTISKAFTASKPNDAHDALHDVGHVLEEMTGLAKGFSDEKKTLVKKSVDELMACFAALDDTMHGGPETPYTKVADRITAAMADLRKASE